VASLETTACEGAPTHSAALRLLSPSLTDLPVWMVHGNDEDEMPDSIAGLRTVAQVLVQRLGPADQSLVLFCWARVAPPLTVPAMLAPLTVAARACTSRSGTTRDKLPLPNRESKKMLQPQKKTSKNVKNHNCQNWDYQD